MASDSGDNPDIQGEESSNTEAAQHNKRVSELLDAKDLHEQLIQRLQDGGHVAKKPNEGFNAGVAWPQFNGNFPFFPFSAPYWGASGVLFENTYSCQRSDTPIYSIL